MNKSIGALEFRSISKGIEVSNEIVKKANVEIDNLYLLDRIRFDRFYSSKKSKLTFSWNNYDNFYLSVSLILFVLVVVIGR